MANLGELSNFFYTYMYDYEGKILQHQYMYVKGFYQSSWKCDIFILAYTVFGMILKMAIRGKASIVHVYSFTFWIYATLKELNGIDFHNKLIKSIDLVLSFC